MLSLPIMKILKFKKRQLLVSGLILGMSVGLAGCGSSLPSLGNLLEDKTVPKEVTGTPEELYRLGDARLTSGNYPVAVKYFEEVDRQQIGRASCRERVLSLV